MPNEKSDIDLVIMLNKVPDKKNFDWMKSYVEDLHEMLKTYFESSNVQSVYDICYTQHAVKFDIELSPDNRVHVDLLISPKFEEKELDMALKSIPKLPLYECNLPIEFLML